MPSAARPQNALQISLNTILQTEAHVRVLRVLSTLDEPVSYADMADRTVLSLDEVHQTLVALIHTGIVEPVEVGTESHVQLRRAHPLIAAVAALFHAETYRVRSIYDDITAALHPVRAALRSVWVEGAAVRCADRATDLITLGVLADGKYMHAVLDHLRTVLPPIERAYDVHVELQHWTMAVFRNKYVLDGPNLRSAVVLFGFPPFEFLASGKRINGHVIEQAIEDILTHMNP